MLIFINKFLKWKNMTNNQPNAQIKINKLLKEAGWHFFENNGNPANICITPDVSVKPSDLQALGNDYENTDEGIMNFVLLDSKGLPQTILQAQSENKTPFFDQKRAQQYADKYNCKSVIFSNGNLHYKWNLGKNKPNLIDSFHKSKLTNKDRTSYYLKNTGILILFLIFSATFIIKTNSIYLTENPPLQTWIPTTNTALKDTVEMVKEAGKTINYTLKAIDGVCPPEGEEGIKSAIQKWGNKNHIELESSDIAIIEIGNNSRYCPVKAQIDIGASGFIKNFKIKKNDFGEWSASEIQ